jgi:hypothetical protein
MTGPQQLLRPEGRLDEMVLHVRPWPDDVVDRAGYDPRSPYAEDFWLPVLGPSTLWLLRRFAAGFDYSPDGFDLDLAETARSLGLSDRADRGSPFLRALNRTVGFGMAKLTGLEGLAVRRRLPPLSHRQVGHLSPALQERHAAWQAGQPVTAGPAESAGIIQRGPARPAGQVRRPGSSPSLDAQLSRLSAERPRGFGR